MCLGIAKKVVSDISLQRPWVHRVRRLPVASVRAADGTRWFCGPGLSCADAVQGPQVDTRMPASKPRLLLHFR